MASPPESPPDRRARPLLPRQQSALPDRWRPGRNILNWAGPTAERSLREALNLDDRHIGVEHIVLGVLDPDGNTAIELGKAA